MKGKGKRERRKGKNKGKGERQRRKEGGQGKEKGEKGKGTGGSERGKGKEFIAPCEFSLRTVLFTALFVYFMSPKVNCAIYSAQFVCVCAGI